MKNQSFTKNLITILISLFAVVGLGCSKHKSDDILLFSSSIISVDSNQNQWLKDNNFKNVNTHRLVSSSPYFKIYETHYINQNELANGSESAVGNVKTSIVYFSEFAFTVKNISPSLSLKAEAIHELNRKMSNLNSFDNVFIGLDDEVCSNFINVNLEHNYLNATHDVLSYKQAENNIIKSTFILRCDYSSVATQYFMQDYVDLDISNKPYTGNERLRVKNQTAIDFTDLTLFTKFLENKQNDIQIGSNQYAFRHLLTVDYEWFCNLDIEKARRDRIVNKVEKLIVFSLSFLQANVDINLNNVSMDCLNKTKTIFENLIKLTDNFSSILIKNGFFKHKLTTILYEVDPANKIFAFMLTSEGGQRAYFSFNGSFDIKDMPFPFGFMNSTKVTLWQTDSQKLDTFVTTQPIAVRPYNASFVMIK